MRRATLMQDHASVCERIWKVFFSEKMRLLPSSAINVGPNGYIQRRAGFDGHRKEILGAVLYGKYSGGGRGVWIRGAGEIWPVEVRTAGFTL